MAQFVFGIVFIAAILGGMGWLAYRSEKRGRER